MKIYDGGRRICAYITPDNSEPIYRDNLFQRGTPTGNGRVHEFNCWDFNPEFARLFKRLADIEEAGQGDRKTITELQQTIADLAGRVAALEGETDRASAKAPEKAKKPAPALAGA